MPVSQQATRVKRGFARIVKGMPATDGAGVELSRVIGQPGLESLDPFLLLDAFRSDRAEDYIAGFPPHPHRGFETVTYLLAGRMRHKDNAGHEGVIQPGGVQWMTAGRGIVHSEMPEQENGLLAGFQLWVNLPAEHKMDAPAYQEYAAEQIPVEHRQHSEIRVIAGSTSQETSGPVSQPLTEALYLDVMLAADSHFEEPLPQGHNAFLYLIEGQLGIPGEASAKLQRDQLAVLTQGEGVSLHSADQPARFLLIAGKPLNEPVARGGPFVMNTKQQIEQAFADYKAGNF